MVTVTSVDTAAGHADRRRVPGLPGRRRRPRSSRSGGRHLQRIVGRADDDEAHPPAELPRPIRPSRPAPGSRSSAAPGSGRRAEATWQADADDAGPMPARAAEPANRRPERPRGVDGLVVVDKEAGWTSHDVVARCRRIFGQRRVGHAGTLDPDATGVLLVGLGRATRLLRFLTALPKTYTAEIVLGTATSTLDASGEVIGDLGHGRRHARPRCGRRPTALTGDDRAGPADGVGGQGRRTPAARAGPRGDRGRAARPAGDRLPLRHRARPARPGVYRVEVECSSGTYVRVLAADLGHGPRRRAPTSANLRRTRIGSFGATDDAAARRRSAPTRCSPRPRPCATSTRSRSIADVAGARSRTGLALDRVPLGAVRRRALGPGRRRRRAAGRLRGDRHRPDPPGRRTGRRGDGHPTTLGRDVRRREPP